MEAEEAVFLAGDFDLVLEFGIPPGVVDVDGDAKVFGRAELIADGIGGGDTTRKNRRQSYRS